jgi:serine/threonine-protein kinase
VAETDAERLTSTGLSIGTPAYMSPEQASGDKMDARSDQYSLATVLYEMLVGEPPSEAAPHRPLWLAD